MTVGMSHIEVILFFDLVLFNLMINTVYLYIIYGISCDILFLRVYNNKIGGMRIIQGLCCWGTDYCKC